MSSMMQRLRHSLSNRWRKNRSPAPKSSPSSIADFPDSIELFADENENPQVPKKDPPALPDFNDDNEQNGLDLRKDGEVFFSSKEGEEEHRVPSPELQSEKVTKDSPDFKDDNGQDSHRKDAEVLFFSSEGEEHGRTMPSFAAQSSKEESQRTNLVQNEDEEEVSEDSPQREESPKHQHLVSICKGLHKGKQGEIVGKYDKRTYQIRLVQDGQAGDTVNVRMTSVVNEGQHDRIPPAVEEAHPPVCHTKGQRWLGIRVRDRETGAVGMVENLEGDQTVNLRLDDNELLQLVPTDRLSPSKEGTILPQHMKLASETPMVRIIAGRHANKIATLVGNGSRRDQVQVEIDGIRFEVKSSSITSTAYMETKAVQEKRNPLQEQSSTGTDVSPNFARSMDPVSFPPGDLETNAPSDNAVRPTVLICAGQHFGKLARVLGNAPQKNLVRVSIDGKVCNVRKSSIEEDVTKTLVRQKNTSAQRQTTHRHQMVSRPLSTQQATAWTLPDTSSTNVMSFAGKKILNVTVDDSPSPEITMLSVLFGDRLFYVNEVLNGRSNQTPLPATAHHQGVRFDLVSTRLKEDDSGGRFSKNKILVHGYVATEGPSIASLSLNDELLRIADFSRLPPRKIASRLELLMSPARFSVHFAREEDFCEIPEAGNVGCGFISEEKMLEILNGNMARAAASRAVAIQVRIFLPRKGVFKGMLMKKLNTKSPIELPPSMMKVPASTHENAWSGAAIVVCKNGVHPSPGSANEYIGRTLNDSLKAPPPKSFEQKIQKELKAMILRLWLSMGVPKAICHNYIKQSVKIDGRNHAWLVGVADPTGSLPFDSVFVPGIKNFHPGSLFVTRSPCVKYEDGRVLQHICAQPSEMSNEAWEWLNGLSFGCIVFSNPRNDMMSIPERIAIGDLDGDLYLVCWDAEILSHMDSSPLPAHAQQDDGVLSTVPSDCNWLKGAQEFLHDVGSLNRMQKLTGKLYTLGEKVADASSVGLKNADAAAFFDAYNQALEYKKHGRPIALPQHLHGRVPKELRSLLDVRSPRILREVDPRSTAL